MRKRELRPEKLIVPNFQASTHEAQDPQSLISCAILLVGPPSAGKTTLSRILALRLPFVALVPLVKPRAPRQGEIDGVDAFFVSQAQFDQLLSDEAFEVSGSYYGKRFGLVRGHVNRVLSEGLDPVLVISTAGAKIVKSLYPRAFIIRLFPASIDVLRDRILSRADYGEAERVERFRRIDEDLEQWDSFDFAITTSTVESALEQAVDIVYSIRCRSENGGR